MFKLFSRKNHKQALANALGDFVLPSFPAVTMQTLELIREEGSCAHQVADLLALDPGLSVRILSAVNSAAYSPGRPVDSLQQAVAMLGMSNLESVILAVAIKGTLPSQPCPGFDPDRFWIAAARRSAASQALAQLLHPATRSQCFTAALLQDMAIPLLAANQPDVYGPLLTAWHAGEGTLHELERAAMGYDHAEVATWLCSEWNLPEALSNAIGGHHAPAGSVEECPAALCLVAMLGETESQSGVQDLIRSANEDHGLSTEVVGELMEQSFEKAGDLAQLLT